MITIDLFKLIGKRIQHIHDLSFHVIAKETGRWPIIFPLKLQTRFVKLPSLCLEHEITSVYIFVHEIINNRHRKYSVPIDVNLLLGKQNKKLEDLEGLCDVNIMEATISEMGTWISHKLEETYQFNFNVYDQGLLQREECELKKSRVMDETGILKVEGGVINSSGQLFNKSQDKFCFEHTIYGKQNKRTKFEWPNFNKTCARILSQPKKIIYKKGRCLNLFSTFAAANFYHNLLDTYGKLQILNECSPLSLHDYDWYVLPINRYPLVRKYLNHLKIAKNKIIFIHNDLEEGYQFDEIHAPSLNGSCKYHRIGAHSHLRKFFLPEESKISNRKIFISREGTGRDMTNEEAVYDFLEDWGFEIILASKSIDIPRVFNESNTIIAPHGAGSTNLIFCKQGTNVIELFPEFYIQPYYMSLAQTNKLNYNAIICKEGLIESKTVNTFDHATRSFDINLELLDSVLTNICNK